MKNVKVINLINGFIRSIDSKSFSIPSRRERLSLSRNSFAKVCDDLDRFWVNVETIIHTEDGIVYVGRISNHLISGQTDYGYDDLIYFAPDNILDINK
jgi:putative heme iron utilization protein